MKKVLKGWLIDNSVTTDNKTDKILLLASAGSLTLDDVLEEMYKQDTGLRPETLHHSVTLYHRVLMDLILNGYSVNTGLFRAVAQLTGVIEGGVWNKERNSIYVSLTQDKVLREEIAKTSVEILGEKSNIMYILETEDKKTGLKDGSATVGRNFFVRSAMLKVVGDDESVGVTLTNAAKAVTKLTDDLITINNPSSLTLLLPAVKLSAMRSVSAFTERISSSNSSPTLTISEGCFGRPQDKSVTWINPSTPPMSVKAPKSVMRRTMPLTCWPASNCLYFSLRALMASSCKT